MTAISSAIASNGAEAGDSLRLETMLVSAAAIFIALLLALSGRLSPWISPDTASYFDLGPLPEALAQPRNPVFGWIVGALPGGFALVPAMNISIYFAAVVLFYRAARMFGLSATAAASMTVGLLLSNVLLLWGNAVIPEVLAVSFAVLALGALLLLAAGHGGRWQLIVLCVSIGMAYVLRPTFMPALLLFPLLYLILRRLKGEGGVGLPLIKVALACALPFIAVSGARLALVQDFNVVSFGGFQMAGMAGLMLDETVVERLPGDVAPLAQEILHRRTQAELSGKVIPTPVNSRGERSFVSAAVGYYDIYARTYDNVLYGVIAPLQADETWVAWNSRLMRFSIATVLAAPERYLAWIVGGASRAAGRLLVTDLPFALGLLALTVVYFVRLLGNPAVAAARATDSLDVPVIVSITLLYTATAGALTALVTFPAARYLDAAGLFLPALPFYVTARLLGRP